MLLNHGGMLQCLWKFHQQVVLVNFLVTSQTVILGEAFEGDVGAELWRLRLKWTSPQPRRRYDMTQASSNDSIGRIGAALTGLVLYAATQAVYS